MLRLGLASLFVAGCSLETGGLSTDGGRDGGQRDGGRVDGATDAGVDAGCDEDACEDGIPCTFDECNTAGSCEHIPDDAECTAAPDGRCDATTGCQYPVCTAMTCIPENGCQTTMCDGDNCVRNNLCRADQQCCGTMCVAPGCDDGNPCTDDTCSSDVCFNTPNMASCDDGQFCTGVDTCMGGSCSRTGDPCIPMGAGLMCDEASDLCVQCTDRAHCPAIDDPAWSACLFEGDDCDETGVESRTVTDYECRDGSCNPLPMPQSRECTRSTTGTACGCGGWGSCAYSDVCDEDAPPVTRTCMYCDGGTCAMPMTEMMACIRDTDRTGCAFDGMACTFDVCVGGSCQHPCRPGCTCGPSGCSCSGG